MNFITGKLEIDKIFDDVFGALFDFTEDDADIFSKEAKIKQG